MKKFLTIVVLTALLGITPACETTGATRVAVEVAQAMISQYSFVFEGYADGVLGVNSQYIAVNALVDIHVRYTGPNEDGIKVVLWEKTFKKGKGRRAYRVVFDDDNFVKIVPVPWNEAARVFGLQYE